MWNLAKSKTDASTIVGLFHKMDLFLDEIAARFSLKILNSQKNGVSVLLKRFSSVAYKLNSEAVSFALKSFPIA